MSAERKCYECAHARLCMLRGQVEDALLRNVKMLDINLPASSDSSFTKVYYALAASCKEYKEAK